jgi:hypothetical protein
MPRDGVAGRADGQVGVAVGVEVAGRQRRAEPVARVRDARHARRVGGEPGAAGRAQAALAAVEHVDGADLGRGADVLGGHAEREVAPAVAVEVRAQAVRVARVALAVCLHVRLVMIRDRGADVARVADAVGIPVG